MTYKKLKCGDAFQFETSGLVYIRCRGGFRHGCGGELHSCNPDINVIKYIGGI